jgi:mannose-1-phosphate guanylyltransferase / phosphomannomutase
MEAAISAGGRGTRLGELTREVPKCLVPVAGKPILEHQLGELERNGIEKVWLLTGHLGELIEEFIAARSWPFEIEILREREPLGTAGGLAALRGRMHEPFLLLYGDLILSMDISRMLRFHEDSGSLVTLLAHPNSHPHDSDLLMVGRDGVVTGILGKKDTREGYFANLVNAGVYILSPKVIEPIEPGRKSDFEKDVVASLVDKGGVSAYRSSEYVKDMGTPERLAQTEAAISSGLVEARRLSNPQRALFLDRDGTINRFAGLISRPEELELLPGAAQAIRAANDAGYLCFVVSNQPVVARNLCTLEGVEDIHRKMETLLGAQGAYLDDIRFCPHHPDCGFPGENAALKIDCECRKPKTGMLLDLAARYNIDIGRSFMIGDSSVDVMTAKNAGLRSILVAGGMDEAEPKYPVQPELRAANLLAAVKAILDDLNF